MTYLEAIKELSRLAGITDSGGPATVKSQTGDFRKAIQYFDIAHEEIQTAFADWQFLWVAGSVTTTAGQAAYPGTSNLETWDVRRFQEDDEPLEVVEWPDYVPDTRDNGRPEFVVIRPDGQMLVVPTPDDAYTIEFSYYRKPKVLVENADTMLIPTQYQRAVIGRALMLYGNFEAAEEAKIQGQELYEQNMQALMNNQLPRRKQRFARSEPVDLTVIPE